MSSSIYVVDSSFRRTQVKVTPATYLREVLEDACKSRKLQPEEYALKTQANKAVDLSQPFRLSGLSAGAKLQLVQASRSPSVVSIALQLPEEQGASRLNDKFPSSLSLWAVLRRFEDGVASQGSAKLNITQQGIPSSNAGSGRLLYRQPCLNAMGRSLENFTDLQKTLSQLGFTAGSVLLRLSYKDTDIPLEEAMTQMSKYFEQDSAADPTVATGQAKSLDPPDLMDVSPSVELQNEPEETVQVLQKDDAEPKVMEDVFDSTSTPASPGATSTAGVTDSIAVFLPPSTSTPAAALHEDNDSAFEPSIDDARALQATLQNAGRNTRLLSDKELEEKAAEQQAKLATVRSVDIRVRYPDQTMIQTTVGSNESSADLYTRVRSTLRYPTEPFELRFVGTRNHQTLPDDPGKNLVKDFAFRGKMLITLIWSPSASTAARSNAPLKDELRTQAQELKVELNAQAKTVEAQAQSSNSKEPQKPGKGKGDIEAKMKKFLGFGKK